MMSLTKNPHPPTKKFFLVQATRLATSFKLLTGSVALTGPEKFPRKVTCVSVFFFVKIPESGQTPKCYGGHGRNKVKNHWSSVSSRQGMLGNQQNKCYQDSYPSRGLATAILSNVIVK